MVLDPTTISNAAQSNIKPATMKPVAGSSPLWLAAQKLESSFIAEMLKSAGVGKPRDSFGGGVGEDGFASFLVAAQADKIVESGGFGLTEAIFNSLVRGSQNNG